MVTDTVGCCKDSFFWGIQKHEDSYFLLRRHGLVSSSSEIAEDRDRNEQRTIDCLLLSEIPTSLEMIDGIDLTCQLPVTKLEPII
jgi:hypothetical protein